MASWFDYVNSAGIFAAASIGLFQIRQLRKDARQRDLDRQTERALEFYHDLVVDGDTADAFNCLSIRLRAEGIRRHGTATWYVMQDRDLEIGGLLDHTPDDENTLLQYFYRVLWFAERTSAALRYELINADVLFDTAGFHLWWWGQLLSGVRGPKAARALEDLARQAADWARRNDEYGVWIEKCRTDFDGSGPA